MSKRTRDPTENEADTIIFVSDPTFTFKLPQNPPAHAEDIPMLRDIVAFVFKIVRPMTHSVDTTRVDMSKVHKVFDYTIEHHLPVIGTDHADYYTLRFALPFNVHCDFEILGQLKNLDYLRIRKMSTLTNQETFAQELTFVFHSKTVAPPQLIGRHGLVFVTNPHYVPTAYVPIAGGGDTGLGVSSWLDYIPFAKRRRGNPAQLS
jgi:hypothetical protein